MRYQDKGFSLVEVLIVVVIIGLLATIAIPNLMASRRAANEASAVAAVNKVRSAQLVFKSGVGMGNFGTAAQLWSRNIIGPRLAAAANVNVGGEPVTNMPRDGYRYRILTTVGDPATGASSTYVISGNPAVVSGLTQSGTKRLCVREDGVLRGSTQNLSTRYSYAQCGFAQPLQP